jgi:hypothetical protein
MVAIIKDYNGDGVDDLGAETSYLHPDLAVVYGPIYGSVSLREAPSPERHPRREEGDE